MRVLHVITSLRTGGAEKLLVDMVPKMRDAGIETDIAVFDGVATPFSQRLESMGVTIHRLSRKSDVYHPALILKLRRIMRNYDVVHTHNTSPQLFAAVASVFSRRPRLVTTEHNTSNRRRGSRFWRIIDRWMYGRYHTIISITEEVDRLLCEHLRKLSTPHIVIHNGIDTKCFMAQQPRTQSDESRTLVMVSAFRPVKDQATLLRAMPLLPARFRLRLVGTGENLQKCKEMAQNLGIADRVSFDGLRTDIPRVYAAADYAVMSSNYEGMSLAMLEGMCSGLPMIASDVPGIRNMVEGAGILFPSGDEAALANAIMRLENDPSLRQSVAEKCVIRAAQYDISRTVSRYIDVYNSLNANQIH